MRLSELMSALGPTGLTEVALLIFLAVFFAVAIRTYWTRPVEHDRNARMPLEDGEQS